MWHIGNVAIEDVLFAEPIQVRGFFGFGTCFKGYKAGETDVDFTQDSKIVGREEISREVIWNIESAGEDTYRVGIFFIPFEI
jgi:hypothetical protein